MGDLVKAKINSPYNALVPKNNAAPGKALPLPVSFHSDAGIRFVARRCGLET
jgi:hypothetical protein